MNKVEIDVYRGWTIFFDTDEEMFYCHSDQYDKDQTKKSFAACKTYIDEFIKDNTTFKSFMVEAAPDAYCRKGETKFKIIGKRKDGKFIGENEQGVKVNISVYDYKNYMLSNKDNEAVHQELAAHDEKVRQIHDEQKQSRNLILAKFKIKTLAQVAEEMKGK